MVRLLRSTLPLLLLTAACSGDNDQQSAPAAVSTEPPASAPAMPRSAAPENARLYFITPDDGAVVSSPVQVEFGLDGMAVVPAGTEAPAAGHHHLIIDAELPPFDLPVPSDAQHLHFGDGSTSTSLELAPGEHTLQLLLGDHLHIPHQPPVSSGVIRITVE